METRSGCTAQLSSWAHPPCVLSAPFLTSSPPFPLHGWAKEGPTTKESVPGTPHRGGDGFTEQILPKNSGGGLLFFPGSWRAAITTALRSPSGPAVNNIPGIMTTRGCQFSAAMDSFSALH